jgi:hypothetical protein
VIGENQSHHGFDHRHSARQDAGIVTPLRRKHDSVIVAIDAVLRLRDRSCGLERDAQQDVFAVADATLNAA